MPHLTRLSLALCSLMLMSVACGDGGANDADDAEEQLCGPSTAIVAEVIDGDTIDLESGERIRYLMIDAPESTFEQECGGLEAKALNALLVEGQEVSLTYDLQCEDDYDRLLAYVSIGDQVINEVMVERGYACVLQIPPNGEGLRASYETLEYEAEMLQKGIWAMCDSSPC